MREAHSALSPNTTTTHLTVDGERSQENLFLGAEEGN